MKAEFVLKADAVDTRDENGAAAYVAMRAAHLHAVRAALEDHVARVDWPVEQMERYRTERLRALLGHAGALPFTPPG